MDSTTLRNSLSDVQDRCWSIPVIAACTTFLIAVVDSSRGYLYVLYMDTYVISHGTASWPDSILMVTQNLAGFAVTMMQNKLSLFSTTMVSATLCAGGIIVAAFCPNIVWTAVAVGGLYGLGFGSCLACLSLYSLLYFTKYRATASSAKYVGWSISGIAWPSFTSFLYNNYGLHGAFLLCGACILQAGPLFMLLKHPRPLTCSLKAQISETQTTSAQCAQPENQSGKNAQSRSTARPPEPFVNVRCEPARIGLSFKSLGTLFQFRDFYVLTFLYAVFDWCQSVFLTTVADYAKDKGATLEKAKFVLTAVAVGNLVGRTAVPWVADRIPFSHAPFAVAGLAASFLSFVAASLCTSFESFAALIATLAVFQGYVGCIKPVLFDDYLGVQYVPIMFGITGLILVPVSMSGPTILGAFRDALGSYDKLYPVLGALDLFGALLLFLLVYRDWARRRMWEVNTVTDVISLETSTH